MEDKIKEIVISVLELAEDDAKQIEEDTDLLEYGLDSMTCVGVVVSLEEEFGITVDEEDLLVENMSTISKIKELVEKKNSSCPELAFCSLAGTLNGRNEPFFVGRLESAYYRILAAFLAPVVKADVLR